MIYNRIVQDCFFSPRHVGVIDLNDHFAVVVKNNQKGQGTIELYMQCNSEGTIVRACFKTNGNPYVVAGLEWLCRQLEGLPLDVVPQIDYQLIVKELDIPVAQYPIALRVIDVYKEALLLMKKAKSNREVIMSVVMHHAESTVPEISFTEAAVKHLVFYLQKNSEYTGVRLSVKKTGCSGLSYIVDYVHAPDEGDLVLALNENYSACIDKSSYPFLKNMSVDYVKQGLNYKFVFNNPNQTGQCGCGESFTVD